MEYLIIGSVACFASLLTFFSGFGLGTILTPVFAVFFPIEVAVALTGIVHFLNNLFKISLVWRSISWKVGLSFGCAAMIGAFGGAYLLTQIADDPVLYSYTLGERLLEITALKLAIAGLIIVFVLFDIIPRLKKIHFGEKALIPGGVLSGFFGGLSGHQGALRSMFLVKYRLSKEAFVATGILIACAVDVTRLSVYYSRLNGLRIEENMDVLFTAVLSAFGGALIGKQVLKNIAVEAVHTIVSTLLIVMGLGIGAGVF